MKNIENRFKDVNDHLEGFYHIIRVIILNYAKKHSKYYYPSFFIGGIIITIQIYELETMSEVYLKDFIFYAVVSFFGIKVAESISTTFSGKNNLFGILKYIYIVFFTYLTIRHTYELSAYISNNIRIQPEIFKQAIYFISTMKSFQFTIFMFIVPVSFSFIVVIVEAVINKPTLEFVFYFVFKSVVLIIVLIVLNGLSLSNNTTFKKSDEFWIAKHGFVDTVLCEGKSYNENVIYGHFRARKLSNQKYLILSKSGKNNNTYNYYELSCKQFKSIKLMFKYGLNSIINKASNIKKPLANRLSKMMHYSINPYRVGIFYLLQTHGLTFPFIHSKIE